jgi:hypothetical protein
MTSQYFTPQASNDLFIISVFFRSILVTNYYDSTRIDTLTRVPVRETRQAVSMHLLEPNALYYFAVISSSFTAKASI